MTKTYPYSTIVDSKKFGIKALLLCCILISYCNIIAVQYLLTYVSDTFKFSVVIRTLISGHTDHYLN